MLSSTAYQRDPLSEKYDTQAGQLLGRAIGARRQWVTTVVRMPSPGPKTREWLRARGINLFSMDAGGLTSYERAFERSVWWNAKRLGISRTAASAGIMQREWGPVTARGRQFAIRIGSARDGRLAVNRKSRSEQWTRNTELQSGGIGSPKRRFA